MFASCTESVQSGRDNALESVWDPDGHAFLNEARIVGIPPQCAHSAEGLHNLFYKERNPCSLFQEQVHECHWHVRSPEEMADHGHGICRRKTLEGECRQEAAALKRRGVANPVGAEEHERHTRNRIDQGMQQRFRAGVDPVQVFIDEDQGLVLGAPQRQSQERIKEPFAPCGRLQGPAYAIPRLPR